MTTGLTAYECTPQQVYKYMVEDILPAGLVPFIKSSPGMGKSSIVREIAKQFGLKLIDVRMSQATPEDMQGLPRFKDIVIEDEGMPPRIRTVAEFAPFDTFPIASDPIPEGYNGWLLFFDEFNSGSEPVQAASYKILLDRMIGQHPLHPNCLIVCAGNKEDDRAIVNPIGTALQSRVITLVMKLDAEYFLKDVAFKQGWDSRIIAYLAYENAALHDFRPDHEEHTFCSPRTWEFMNKLVTGYDDQGKPYPKPVTDDKVPLYAGTITSGYAVKFVNFVKVYQNLPRIETILRDPITAPLPIDHPTAFATVIHLIEKADDKTFEPITDYVERLERIEMKVVFYRGLLPQKPHLKQHPAFRKSIVRISRYLHDDELDAAGIRPQAA